MEGFSWSQERVASLSLGHDWRFKAHWQVIVWQASALATKRTMWQAFALSTTGDLSLTGRGKQCGWLVSALAILENEESLATKCGVHLL